MRILLKFTADELSLPMDYKRGIQGFLYSCLSPEIGSLYHDEMEGMIKPFVFSSILGRYETINGRIVFNGPCSLYVASPHMTFLNEIYETICETGMIMLYDKFIYLDEIKPFNFKLKDGTETYNTISPITVYTSNEEGKRVYLEPSDRQFVQLVKENLLRKYKLVMGQEYSYPLNVYHFTNVKRLVCMYKGTGYVSYRCRFQVTAPAIMHQMILDTGVGYRNSAGMGMVEITRTR